MVKKDSVEKFYKEETGRKPSLAPKRIEKIKNIVNKSGLPLKSFKIEQHKDPSWNKRKNRTPLEKEAVQIGYTNDKMKGYVKDRFWLIPKHKK